MPTCPYCNKTLVEVDNPLRQEVRHRRGEESFCPGPPKAHVIEYTDVPWFAVVDDLIGGWAIATEDKPTSQLDVSVSPYLGAFLSEGIAKYIARLHNLRLTHIGDDRPPYDQSCDACVGSLFVGGEPCTVHAPKPWKKTPVQE